MNSIKFGILEGMKAKPFIEEIGTLLYGVYITEFNWNFADDNPSKICIETDNKGNKMLLDKFMRGDENLINQTTWIVNLPM